MTDFTHQIHAEKSIDGFTALDGTVRFYGFVQAILLRTRARNVLDFGAGRGAGFSDDQSEYRRRLRDLRAPGAKVVACDVDSAVLEHPASDQKVVIAPDKPLPFDDDSFDVVVSDMTFEHIENAAFVSRELSRVTRPGGFICARTPNKRGYVKFFSSLSPNRAHARILKSVQPDRKSIDVFPTKYAMNDPKSIRRLFPGHNVHYYYDSGDPSYYLGNPVTYRALLALHKILPSQLSTAVCFFIEKPGATDGDRRLSPQ
jgi:SAM-dependent methyltransferase